MSEVLTVLLVRCILLLYYYCITWPSCVCGGEIISRVWNPLPVRKPRHYGTVLTSSLRPQEIPVVGGDVSIVFFYVVFHILREEREGGRAERTMRFRTYTCNPAGRRARLHMRNSEVKLS